MPEQLVLYVGEKNISSWSMRAHVALKAKGLPFEERTISLREDRDRAKRRAISPTGKVPCLHAGSIVIPDSLAIIEYLEETYPAPAHPALWPADPAERAHARWLAAAMHSGFPEVRRCMSFNLCFLPKPPPATPEALAEAAEMLGYWEDALSKKKAAGPYLFGAFSGADVMYATAAFRLKAFHVPAGKTPLAAVYLDAVLDHPAVRSWTDEARRLTPVMEY